MKDNTKANLAFLGCIASIIALVLLFCQIWRQCSPIKEYNTKQTTDTVYVNKYSDTIQVTKTDTLWRTKTITKTQIKPQKRILISKGITTPSDTLNANWTQPVQEYDSSLYSYTYEGEDTTNENIKINYYIKATGRDVTLDTLQLNAQYAEITNNDITKILNKTETYKTHTATTTMQTKKQSRFNFTIGVGAGWGIINKKPDIFVGGTLGIRLF